MFPGCPEHCNAEGTHNEYSENIACRLGDDYHNHYLKKDVLLLADVLEKYIYTCLKFYKLDPGHQFSSAGLSWDVKLEKISNIGMYLFIEKGLRGGISYIAKRYAKTNNKDMKNYDSTKPSKFITYLDMNNFYGWAMSRYIPYGRFKWLKSADNFDKFNQCEKANRIYSRS